MILGTDGEGLRLAVVGTGEVGIGWAALAAARGRPVALFDHDPTVLDGAIAAVHARVGALIRYELVTDAAARRGLASLAPQGELAAALTGADWVIEAVPESLAEKRAVLASVERHTASSRPSDGGPIVASSSSGLHASELADGLARPDRVIVVHPLVPVEVMPVVEVIPGPATGTDVVAAVREELAALGRIPIVLRREVTGNAVGRIAAAVWRECIDLVLDGTLDAAEVDRLVAAGPCLGWAAAGPHLTYELAAGDAGIERFMDHLVPTFEEWWRGLSTRTALGPAERARLAGLIASAYPSGRDRLREERDRRLAALVQAFSETSAPR